MRVDALAQEHQGEEFVTAVERLAEELGPEGRPLLQEILLERAAEEESFQRGLRRRFEARGWTSRTLARFEGLWRDDAQTRWRRRSRRGLKARPGSSRSSR